MQRGASDAELIGAARVFMRISLLAADRIGEVSVVQLRALTVLDHLPQANLGELADGMGVTVSTASRLVGRLVTAGLVDRRAAEHTRRELALRLTDLGRDTLARYDSLRLTLLHQHLDGMPATERQVALEGLQAFGTAATVGALGAALRGPADPPVAGVTAPATSPLPR